jgi:hypothetical protein
MTNEEIEQAKDGLRLQRFWPHEEDIVFDAGRALEVIEELQLRCQATEAVLDRITEKQNWEILIDMQRDQFKVRKAFKKVIKQLDDAVKEATA